MKDILENYNRIVQAQKEHRESIEEKIAEKRGKIQRLEKAIEKLQKEEEKEYTGWVDGVVRPLAQKLAENTGLYYEIYGPFGLDARTSIYLRADMKKSITEQDCLGITLVPRWSDGDLVMMYETGETTNQYQPGSIGWMNGMNNIEARLPETIEEIMGLLRKSGPC